MSNTALLSARNVTKLFGGLTAVNDVSFAVNEKQIVGIIGPNGAGKSTLFNLLSGLATLTSGEILFNGCDMGKVPAHGRSAIGMTRTFQIVRLFDNLTVLDNVMLGGHSGTTQGFLASMMSLPPGSTAQKLRTFLMCFARLIPKGQQFLSLNTI